MELEIKIDGMMCEGCTSRVEETLKKASGVRKVVVSILCYSLHVYCWVLKN